MDSDGIEAVPRALIMRFSNGDAACPRAFCR